MTTFSHTLDIAAGIDAVFAAIAAPERLARWWGPDGFSNTFELCDFRAGGRWVFVMHGPDGRDYPNENVFEVINPPQEVIVRHASEPHFRLVIGLTASATGTTVHWAQTFDSPDVAAHVAHIVVPANEQNLQRLAAEVLRAGNSV
ncbi:Activator of Hsp90 ATPase homolog 1-like protein [Andreprevotia lacus DSM 23236]|uniref:Activator of Hsp90 ATPase homolog 1-like protein n=1 Tax=Andreprevotia lacus DSM 23236 TaxID=1121001 RepID=A0A1W1XRF8_9NEIS|nr:SRPBCC domain-containing protein [Andreprevotia lacus]SMC26088.1 Activator of Hsp90 ATPase homolog 1-like protein [Andreprevotia lacus DSM 23236]